MYVTVDDNGVKSKGREHDGNIVMYSSCKNFESKLPFKNFSIKYVMQGDELYRLKERDYLLHQGEYLLCNNHCEGKVSIDSKAHVKGICIDIARDLLSEVVAIYKAPDTNIADLALDNFFNSPDFLEHHLQSSQTHLGKQLNHLDAILLKNPYGDYEFSKEFFYKLSEGVIADYIPVVKQLQSIRCVKSTTKRDLLKKLAKGKSFIDLYFAMDIDVSKIAVESNLSQYHFFRLFKNTYGQSPYQYIKQKRMQKANELLKKQSIPLANLATEVGYSDIHSFSKAFKQFFGKAPSKALE
ncbi:MAG: helix-turn-helix transcriptional regulator [Saprospiraceae bacterium]|nr:helix-turn-helix transcriptional regulator [Candidatus Vicinibacter affinis]MBK9639798.1 helix-turn-helix transcriptional regulator [Candidatus Vicinibacter affinis]MBP7305900.1 helix-turn-helix transcriptional regulator [Saprospiraceae bacterium]